MRFLGFTLLMIIFVIFTASAQPVSQVKAAFSSGDAAKIGGYFKAEVEISINRDHSALSKQEAIAKLRSFFSKNRAKDFTHVHEGSSRSSSGTGYLTGDLITASGKFRVFVYFEGQAKGTKIKEIRIDQR
jgi:hypothetical protein